MRKFELYLDESGSFIEEEKAKSPSLIGGILVKNEPLESKKADDIMKEVKRLVGDDYVHITDLSKKDKRLSGSIALTAMKKIKEIPSHFVIFENRELLDFQDDKILYLNMMVEGILNLLEKLSLEKKDELSLDVIIAVRRDLKQQEKSAIIELEEYQKRINEQIFMRLAEKNLFLSKNCQINISLSSARKNPKLMLADIVCNTRLTRTSGKFTKEQKEEIENLFQHSKYIFSIFREDIQKKLANYLMQNNIADAIFLLMEVEEERKKKELETLLVNQIKEMPQNQLRIQFELLSLKIKSLIDVQRELVLCEKFLKELQDGVMKKIKKSDYIIQKLKLDISLYLLTIYTHQGNSKKAKEQVDISSEELKGMGGSWESLDYYYILKTREAIYYSTCFKEEEAIKVLTTAIDKLELIMEDMKKIEEFKVIKSDMLAKAVGTRLQSYTNLITDDLDMEKKKEYYEMAVKDSDYAISQFVSDSDKKRQYQYRSLLECSMGNIERAKEYLLRATGVSGNDFPSCVQKIAQITDFSKNFLVNNYLFLLQKAMEKKEVELANKMYDAFCSNKELSYEYLLEEGSSETYNVQKHIAPVHPFETIYWSLSRYFYYIDKEKAKQYLQKAEELTLAMEDTGIRVFYLVLLADKVMLAKDKAMEKENLIQAYDFLLNEEQYSSVWEFLKTLEEEFLLLKDTKDLGEINRLCKIISSRIKI